jgi:hypothetical protein
MTTAASLGIDRRTLDHRLDKYEAEEQKGKDIEHTERAKRAEELIRARGADWERTITWDSLGKDMEKQLLTH